MDSKIIGIGLEVDIWAAGVVLFECLKEYPPFSANEENGQKGIDTIKRRITEYRFMEPPPVDVPEVSPEAEDLIMGMLKFDFNESWTAEQCLQHPWITDHPLS
ncbi:3b8976b5-d08c-4376-ab47-e8fb167649db-CDS [Sclerotinia trifoliorum]|uniref:3b8976b5-d08c-4376-ab47-e8fb167649db-CDS n=1 Tax=Sclerotinia trifoliorum TaxID=28548 RepID=A0A8H2ZNT1_9HELO|nr:3b8976b5-d08c-4376-ab47-e8fb167649db-CDS [Sclerotinia trifoliorum]